MYLSYFFPFSILFLRFIHVWIKSWLFLYCQVVFYCVNTPTLNKKKSLGDGQFSCFKFLAIRNKTVMNTHIHALVNICIDVEFLCLKYIYILLYQIVPNWFPKWLHNFIPHQQCMSFLVTPCLCTILILSVFLIFHQFQWVYIVSHCEFNLAFLNDWRSWYSFNIFISHFIYLIFKFSCLFSYYWIWILYSFVSYMCSEYFL